MFTTKIRKVGRSFWIPIPKELVKEQKLRLGDEVEVSILKKRNIHDALKLFDTVYGTKPSKRER